jgi:hypothetical protein
MMDAIPATIVSNGQAICEKTKVAVEVNYLHRYFIDSYKTP